ncbi:protein unc-80 homolog [Sinocyclocheilus grahami]|uniref:protein unc-80 homolog n=1 Tax=Sinocyclocheilus grahami TaxID=75366 RepID=UPI0007AD0AC9|nr:PREDICTED: protein unc-80 homolog [Sinocyclocheilus grahami]
MVKRKSLDDSDQENCRGIPFPIQTFLWRQTSAFLRPKLGKQYEASCVSFERVLVENKLHGLSPALTEAIQSISRWELVQAALPHVLHCTAILLSNRNKLGHQDKLGVAETKLLHTLHWMLLEAAQECHQEPGLGQGWSGGSSGSSSAYLQPMGNQGLTDRNGSTTEENEYARAKLYHKNMATVELFVFLFAPLINRIKESDLTFRLAGGLVIWQPMWEHRHPDVPAFSALVKPMRNIITAKRNSLVNNQCSPHDTSNPCPSVVCESVRPDSSSPSATGQSCRRGNSVEKGGSSQQAFEKGFSQPKNFSVPVGISVSQRARYATYFDVAVLRCLMQPHWTEEGVHWALTYYLQRLRQILQEKPERPPEPLIPPLPRPRSSSMVAATPSLVNTHKTQDMTQKCNEESRSLSSETFSKVSFTNLRRQAVPDLSTEMGMNIFKKFKNRREDRERKGSIPFHYTGKKRQRRMGIPFLMHEDHLDVSPTRSTFSFGSFSGLGDDRRTLDRGGWPSTIMGKLTRRGSSDTAGDVDSLGAKHFHSHHNLPEHSNSHSDNTIKEGVRSQISTITMATFNTTVASFNVGYTDFFTEHIKKLCNPIPIPEMPCEPLACSNLPRSLTDSCINYTSLEDRDTIEGTNNFILKNGMLDLMAILRALYAVLTHDIGSRICDVALNIIECLLQLGVVPSVNKKASKPEDKEAEHPKEGASQSVGGAQGEAAGGTGAAPNGGGGGDGGGGGGESRGGSRDDIKNNKDNKDGDTSLSTHRLALTMLIKIVKSLGCAYGCGEGHRGLSGDRLRMQAQNCLTTLYKLDKVQFRQTMKEYVNKDSLNNIVDFLHALLGFCMEPITDKYGSAGERSRRANKRNIDKAGFGNNFTTGGDKSLAQSMETVVVGCMFKSLITRCASTTHELHSSENLGLYCDIRQLVQFIKESHGNVFRRVALSALLDSAEKLNTTKNTDEKETKPSSAKNEEQIPGALLGRKDFWRKMFKSQSAASDTSSQSEQDTSECTTAHSGTTTDRRSRSRSRRISLRKKLKLPIACHRKARHPLTLSMLRNWLKRSSLSGLADGVEDLLDISSVDRLSFIRQSSKVKFTSAVKLSEGSAIEYGREEEENFFKRLGKWRSGRRNPSKVHHTEEKDGCHGFQERLAASQEAMKNKNIVNLGAIRQGMKRFQFLLNCCEPGTIPDASILAAALDLEAPVVARASLFLECARFVHRCNRGNWPEWMKGHHVNITKRGLSRGRSPVAGNKRNTKLQWNAAKHFYQWGDAIGTRLSEICHSDSESPANILGFIYDEESKRRAKKEDEEEDYLDDNTVNPTKCGCPFALKMAACQLLLEITTFLRETFPCLPRPRTEPLVDLESCRLRLDPELGRHRYERKISFAGILDDEDGHDSLNSSSHTLKSDTGCEEKKSSQEPLAPIRKIRIGGSRLLQIKGARSFRVKKGGSLSSIRRAGSLKSTKTSRQDSESENDAESERLLSQSRDTVRLCAAMAQLKREGGGSERGAGKGQGTGNGGSRRDQGGKDIGRSQEQENPGRDPESSQDGGPWWSRGREKPWWRANLELMAHMTKAKAGTRNIAAESEQLRTKLEPEARRGQMEPEGWRGEAKPEEWNPVAEAGRRLTKRSRRDKGAWWSPCDDWPPWSQCSDKSCLRTPSMKRRPTDSSAEGKKDTGMLKYIRNQVMSLSPAPLSLLIKAAPILTEDMYGDILPAAWELLLSVDEHMAAAAAALFLLCAVKVPDGVTEMMMAEFQHKEACQRINSILKFYTVWRFRYQVWPRMEEGAQQIFKIPPPSINFTLPSPILGMPCVPIFDPPWVPVNAGTVPDAISEDQSKSFSARAVSRSHQRAEHILKNMQQEEEKRRLGREASIITAIPIAQEACYEPTCSPPPEQEEEVEDVMNLTSRRLSVSPSCASSNSHRNYSFRRGSVWSVRSMVSAEDDENTTELTPTHHMLQPPQSVFPPCICAAVLPIVHLMEDGEVREDGVAVCAVAQQVLWNCLIEDPALVLRHFLEKLTVSNRQDELMYMLRKLLLNIGDLPAQTSHILFNYLVGLIMYFVRTPCEWGMDAISATLTFLWEVVGYVEGLFFKDLKQTMKKEQCEVKLLVTASMPGTKTLVVHGQNECDIPTQLPVHEDTQFEALLKECLEFFNIPEARSANYFLMDKRWNLIHYAKTYVRDIYPFRRSVSPQLNLVHMLPEKGQELIQKQVMAETGFHSSVSALTRRQVEWEAASSLIEGICLTLHRQPIISFLPHLRSLINVCVNLVMGVVGPSSVADGLPLLHLSPYLSPPLPFSTAVVRLVAMQIQALKDDFPLSHVISPFTNQERREGMLLNLLIPFVLTVGSGNKDSPNLEQPEVFLLLQTVINILLPPRIISTSRSKNFVLDASPAHCSTPGDTGKDLRREGLAESTSQAAYLALKVVLICFERQLGNQWYKLSLQVKEMALRKVGGLAFWDFIDFIVRTRIPIFILLRPFIQCKLLTQPAESQEEITARHHIAEQLERRFIPRSLCKSSLFAEFSNELKILKEAVHSGSAYQGKTSISTVGTSTSAYRLSLATMSRSNTGTGTVWEQESQPSRQPSQDTLSRCTDEEEEENDSISIPSVVSEHEAFLPRLISQRRFSSHITVSAATQPEPGISTMLPSHSEPNVLDESQGLLEEGNLSRVASVQSEPGQQNLLIQPPLGRKRGLRQLRRPLLSIQRVQDESRGRQGARLSTTRRNIQPKSKPLDRAHGDQKRSVNDMKKNGERYGSSENVPVSWPFIPLNLTAYITLALFCSQYENKDRKDQGSVRSSLSPTPSAASSSTSRACSPLPPPLPVLSTPSRLAPTQIRESPEDEETTGLLQNTDTSPGAGEDRGTENPLLTSLLTPHALSPLPLSPVDLDLDESHV